MTREPLRIDKTIRLIELFAGYGSQAMALERLGAKFEHYRAIEFDKYAMASYNAVHGTDFEPTDIKDVKGIDLGIADKEHFTYLLTYSFPCTDLSIAGKQAGMARGSGTRSGLLWEVERLLTECKNLGNLPDILLMENVTEVHGYKNKSHFDEWVSFLDSLGYTSYLEDLNAADYLVAQHRERSIMVSILGNYNFKFPVGVPLNTCMADYLEDKVDEKFYVKSQKAYNLIVKLVDNGTLPSDEMPIPTHHQHQAEETTNIDRKALAYLNSKRIDKVDVEVAKTLCARDYKGFGTGFDTMNGVIEITSSEGENDNSNNNNAK